MCGLFQDNYVVEDCISDRVVMKLWYRTVRSRPLHSSDEDRVDLKQLEA